jgi:hypothetical protein
MAKKTTKPQQLPGKLYACCSKPECGGFQQTINFLKTWGLDHKPQQEGKRQFFDVEIPDFWNENRRSRFAEALAKQPAGH